MIDNEKLTAEELANSIPADELDDIVEDPATYEIWIETDADDISVLVDGGYIDEDEARKCFEYFTNRENVLEVYPNFKDKSYFVRLYLTVMGEAIELVEEKEIK